jgi:DNA-binding NarL/FixJ family response regulator
MKPPIRIVLADDHAMLRQGTTELLRREPDLDVIGEAADGAEAIALACQLRPDVVIMDIRMPGMSGIEATRQLRDRLPDVRVLVLSAHDDDQYVFSLLQAGARGYLLKSAPVSELVRAIRQVHDGEAPLDASITRKIVLRMSGEPAGLAGEFLPVESLTPRELEVLKLLAQGLSNRAIGEALSISDRTVQAHCTNIFSKMHVASRMDAVLAAIRRGWLSLEP